jgi:hypothetical protein
LLALTLRPLPVWCGVLVLALLRPLAVFAGALSLALGRAVTAGAAAGPWGLAVVAVAPTLAL